MSELVAKLFNANPEDWFSRVVVHLNFRSNCEADQPLSFPYTDSTISLLKSEISCF